MEKHFVGTNSILILTGRQRLIEFGNSCDSKKRNRKTVAELLGTDWANAAKFSRKTHLVRMNISGTLSVENTLFRLNPFSCQQEIFSTGRSGSKGKYRTCH